LIYIFPVSDAEGLADLGKIILKVISDQIKIIFSKKNLKSDQDLIFSRERSSTGSNDCFVVVLVVVVVVVVVLVGIFIL
jgi:hypothetical protein